MKDNPFRNKIGEALNLLGWLILGIILIIIGEIGNFLFYNLHSVIIILMVVGILFYIKNARL